MTVLAERYGEQPVTIREIAEAKELSSNYLEQLLAPLRRAGLVRSVRGPQGGYRLARAPENITVGDILQVLEGPLLPVECADETISPGCCDEDCPLRQVWIAMRDRMEEVIDAVSLRDLTEDVGSALGRVDRALRED